MYKKCKDPKETMVMLAQLAHKDPKETLVILVQLVHKDPKETMVMLVQLVHKVHLDLKGPVSKDPKV